MRPQEHCVKDTTEEEDKKIKVNLTENAWNNLGQLSSTLPRFLPILDSLLPGLESSFY